MSDESDQLARRDRLMRHVYQQLTPEQRVARAVERRWSAREQLAAVFSAW